MLRHWSNQSGEETSEERNPKEASVGHLANPQGPGRDFRGVSNPEVGSESVSALEDKPQEGGGVRKDVRRRGRRKALKGEPQGRIRDEISSIGHEGSKTPRGRETLRVEHNRVSWDSPGELLLVAGKTLKGNKPRKGQ